jgi:small neutral amino acid transporter SnatA (MarC family)
MIDSSVVAKVVERLIGRGVAQVAERLIGFVVVKVVE